MGHPESTNANTVYIFDFGLSRFFKDGKGNILQERQYAGFRGTLRYCSIATHQRHVKNVKSFIERDHFLL